MLRSGIGLVYTDLMGIFVIFPVAFHMGGRKKVYEWTRTYTRKPADPSLPAFSPLALFAMDRYRFRFSRGT